MAVLSKDVISVQALENFHDELKLNLYSNINNGQLCCPVDELERVLGELKRSALGEKRTVEEEVPLNRLLYEYIYRTLPSIFVVESRQENIRTTQIVPEEVNEYGRSKADLNKLTCSCRLSSVATFGDASSR